MSKIIIEIENDKDAQRAQKILTAYLGNIEDPEDGGPHHENEEPKKEVAKKTTPKKDPVKKTTPKKDKPDGETEPESDEVEETEATDGVDLKTLTGIAKDAVAKTDRATVKETIGKYGEKLSAVNESDYEALAEDLKAL